MPNSMIYLKNWRDSLKKIFRKFSLTSKCILRTLEMPFTFDIWAKNAPITIKS